MQPFASPHEVETCPYNQKKSWRLKTDWPGRHLGSPHSSSLMTDLSMGERFWSSGYTTTLTYWAHKHQYAIGTFNTCSWRPIHRFLTNTGGGYSLGGAGLSYTTPWHSRPTISTFHLGGRPISSLTIIYQINQSLSLIPMAATWSSDHSTIYHKLQLRLAIANNLSLAMRKDRSESNLNATRVSIQLL
jgi:hypothetical protein